MTFVVHHTTAITEALLIIMKIPLWGKVSGDKKYLHLRTYNQWC